MKKKILTLLLAAFTAAAYLCGCGDKGGADPTPTQVIPYEEPVFTSTPVPTDSPTPTPLPEIGKPSYKFAFLDHAKLYERYYSTYYFEFDEPGYYISGKYLKAGYYNTDTGEEVEGPTKVLTGEVPSEDGKTRDFVLLIFMSKEDKLTTDNLSFDPEVSYKYDTKHKTKVETDPFTINTKKEDMNYNIYNSDNNPLCLDGHLLVLQTNFSGTHYGSPENDKTKDFCAREYNYYRLSYEDIDYEAMKKNIHVCTFDENGQLVPFTPPEGFDTYVGLSQSTDDGLRFLRISVGLAYPKGIEGEKEELMRDIVSDKMVLVYVEDNEIKHIAMYN